MNRTSGMPAARRVSFFAKIGWGMGGLADNFIMNALIILAMPIYNIGLGMDSVKVGIALSIPRFIDAIADPIMGNISDNTRSRWGRRRPYIVVGALLSAALLPLLWSPPFTGEEGRFWYFTGLVLIYSLAYTIYVVPYTALGYEMTEDYDERTRVLAWRMYIGLGANFALPWLYKLCLNPVFGGSSVTGARWVSVGLGLIIVASGIIPAIVGRETVQSQRQPKIKLGPALLCTLKNRPFFLLLVVYIIIISGIFTSSALGLYVNIYLVCGGNQSFGATLSGYSGTVAALTSYLSLPLITWISVKGGKRRAMITGLAFGLLGNASLWFTLRPDLPYAQLFSFFLSGLGLQGCWLMVSSMVADICDEDELQTGLRREGVYGAVIGFALKLALGFTALSGGLVLKLAGFNPTVAAAGKLSSTVVENMKELYVGIQCVALLAAIGMFFLYPLTRAQSEETRRILNERRETAAA